MQTNKEQFREDLYLNYFKDRYQGINIEEKLKEDVHHLEKELLPYFPADKNIRVIDIGCGHGNMMYLLEKKGYKNVQGIDISKDQVEMAHRLGMTQAIHGDLGAYLDENQNSFEVILAIDIIEHIPKGEVVEVLRKCYKALKPGGVAIFRTPNADGVGNTVFSAGDFSHETILNGFSARQISLAAGFKKIEIHPSYIHITNPLKEMLRKAVWFLLSIHKRIELFAAGISTKDVVHTPNLVFTLRK